MTYRVEIAPGAAREIRKLPREAAADVAKALGKLAEEPRPAGAKRIEGVPGCYRVRSGIYRIVYTIEDDVLKVSIVTVGHRKEVYQRLREKFRRRGQQGTRDP